VPANEAVLCQRGILKKGNVRFSSACRISQSKIGTRNWSCSNTANMEMTDGPMEDKYRFDLMTILNADSRFSIQTKKNIISHTHTKRRTYGCK
jgi:hypothetical protein